MVKTPYFLIDEARLVRNLEILSSVSERAGCRILLAQKAFSAWALYPLIGKYLAGTTASSLFEARLGKEEMGGETHIYNPAYTDEDFPEILKICDHIVFNSVAQWRKFRPLIQRQKKGQLSLGIRVNHGYSEVERAIYNPCAPGSRLGCSRKSMTDADLDGISGLHFHTMCEQDAGVLVRTLPHFIEQFGEFFPRLEWVNFGGGHHITRPDYDVDLLCETILKFRAEYPHLRVYLEPGEAVALNAGTLVTKVLDVIDEDPRRAILDFSPSCHCPDIIEMPFRPVIEGAGEPGEKRFTYILGGPTCLAGDVAGTYSFDEALTPGRELIIRDMAIYSMVKTNTFNGINLPAIAIKRRGGEVEIVKEFGYDDFKGRLS